MNDTFRGFMSRIIDYAGLFPPAAQDLGTAIRAFARYRAGRDAWMLGRFIVPAARLAELAPYRDEIFDVGEPLRLSILAGFGETEEEALAAIEADVRSASAFHERHKGRASIEAIETKLPDELAENRDPNRIAAYARRFGGALAGAGAESIEACLADEDAAHFAFGEDAFSWNDASVPAAEVIQAREEFATGFGSCSFDEPREDLAGLGWMDPIADGG